MNTQESNYVFTDYFLRTGDVEPVMDGDNLTIYNSKNGSGNKFTSVSNIIAVNTDHLTSVLCAWHCRHSGSQFWRHYRDGERVNWKQLDDGERMLILDAFAEPHIPGWAKLPGKLTRDYLKPNELQRLEIDEQGTIYGYKYLKWGLDEAFHSIAPIADYATWYDNELEADVIPTEENNHGIYAMKSRKNPILYEYMDKYRKLVKLALSGIIIEANEGLRAQHAQIVEILK